MGELTNPRYERFAQELAAGNTADAAYEAAGHRKHRGNAARLSAKESIKNRVREIQAVGAEYAAVTVQSLIDEGRHRGAGCVRNMKSASLIRRMP
jgi:phage terminase small subunit